MRGLRQRLAFGVFFFLFAPVDACFMIAGISPPLMLVIHLALRVGAVGDEVGWARREFGPCSFVPAASGKSA